MTLLSALAEYWSHSRKEREERERKGGRAVYSVHWKERASEPRDTVYRQGIASAALPAHTYAASHKESTHWFEYIKQETNNRDGNRRGPCDTKPPPLIQAREAVLTLTNPCSSAEVLWKNHRIKCKSKVPTWLVLLPHACHLKLVRLSSIILYVWESEVECLLYSGLWRLCVADTVHLWFLRAMHTYCEKQTTTELGSCGGAPK